MLLAARALGPGATLTTPHLRFEKETEEAFELPSDVHSYALLPMGYPMGGSGRSAARCLPISCIRTDGASPIGIYSILTGPAVPGLPGPACAAWPGGRSWLGSWYRPGCRAGRACRSSGRGRSAPGGLSPRRDYVRLRR